MISSPSLQELAELPHRIERLEAELLELRQRLGALEPPAAPLTVRQVDFTISIGPGQF